MTVTTPKQHGMGAAKDSCSQDPAIFQPAPSRESCWFMCMEVASCLSLAPFGWLCFGCKFLCCSVQEMCVLCWSHDGNTRMGAIERLMRRVAQGVPRVLPALQLATDVTARLPMLRRMHLALSGRGVEAYDAREEVGGGEWVWLDGRAKPTDVPDMPLCERKLVFYIHGGAFVLCNPATHRSLTCNVARVTGALVLAVDYRRPPQHVYPSALEDVLEAYRRVLSWFPPKNVIVAGESAGGNLAVALCLQLAQLGLPQPGGLVLLSPWTDLADRSLPSWDACPDYLPADLIAAFSDAYVGSSDSKHELTSPSYSSSLHLLPRTLLVFGSGETLARQQARFGEALKAQGVPLTTYVGPNQVHAFPVYADVTYGSLGQAVVMTSAMASAFITLAVVAVFVAFFAAALRTSAATIQALIVGCVAFSLAQVMLAWLRRKHLRNKLGTPGGDGMHPSSSESSYGSVSEDGEDMSLDESDDAEGPPPPYEAYRQIGLFARQVWSAGEA